MILTVIAVIAFLSATVLIQWLFTEWMFNREEDK